MSKISETAERISGAIRAAHRETETWDPYVVRNKAIAEELDAFLAPIAHEADAYKAQQADLWLGAVRACLRDIGVHFTMQESDDFFGTTFGDAAAAIIAEHRANARAWADELDGRAPIEALDEVRAAMEDEARGSRSAAWN